MIFQKRGTECLSHTRQKVITIKNYGTFQLFIIFAGKLSCGVTGNTSDSGSEESRFEPWQDNESRFRAVFLFLPGQEVTERSERIPMSIAISGSPGRTTKSQWL